VQLICGAFLVTAKTYANNNQVFYGTKTIQIELIFV